MPTSRPTLDALNIDAVPPGGDYDAEVERPWACARKLMLDPGNNEFCLLKPTNWSLRRFPQHGRGGRLTHRCRHPPRSRRLGVGFRP